MKRMINSIRIAGTLLMIAAVLTCSSSAWARGATVGAFVLPLDVQSNGALLPAGEYHFTLQSDQFGGILLIRDGQQNNKMFAVTSGIGTRPVHSALTLVRRKGKWHVASLALEPEGTTLMYSVPSPTKAEGDMEAATQVIPVRIVRS